MSKFWGPLCVVYHFQMDSGGCLSLPFGLDIHLLQTEVLFHLQPQKLNSSVLPKLYKFSSTSRVPKAPLKIFLSTVLSLETSS